jgi:hypothetical protein
MLSKEQENMLKVRSVVATMAIEDMYLDNEFIDKLLKVMNGELSSDELREEIRREYANI